MTFIIIIVLTRLGHSAGVPKVLTIRELNRTVHMTDNTATALAALTGIERQVAYIIGVPLLIDSDFIVPAHIRYGTKSPIILQ